MRAQIWSLDAIFAIIIFSFTITILAVTWFNVSNELALTSNNNGGIISIQAKSFADIVMSPGSPSNWYSYVNTTNTLTWNNTVPGILVSYQNNFISPQKLDALQSMSNYNYRATKSLLGIGYNYYIDITGEYQQPGGINITIGSNPNTNAATTVYAERRSGTINGVPVSINIYVWTNATTGAG